MKQVRAKSRSGSSRKKKIKTRQKKEAWQSNIVILALRKMKLVGLRQALKPGIYWAERLFWAIVFFVCLGCTAYLTVVTVKEHSAYPILHTFHEDQKINRVPFPSTTITGTSIMKNNAIKDAKDLYRMNDNALREGSVEFTYKEKQWTEFLVNVLMFAIDHLCELVNSFATRRNILDTSKSGRLNLKAYPEWVATNHVTLRDNKDDPGIRDHVVPFLKQKTLDCKKILAACMWEGEERICTDLFVPVQTDVGTGCSFNRIPEEFLRKKQGFISLFHQHEYSEEELNYWRNFKADNLDSIAAKGVQDFVAMLYPRVQHHAGKLRGLSFLIMFDDDDEDEEGMSCPILDSNGYLLGIHSPFEEPQMMKTGLAIPPKHEIFVKVKAELTIADEDIQTLGIDKRKCYFQNENRLRNFKVYTMANCHQECLGRRIHNACNCTLLTLSAGENEPLCGPFDVKCVQNITATMENGGYEDLCKDPICYAPCTDLKYDADATYLPYHKQEYLNFTNLGENFQSRKSLVTSIAHVTFGSDSVTTRERKMQYSFYVLFGVIGGAWGMAMEFSIFTFFNILAGFGVLIFSKLCCVNEEDEDLEIRNCDEEAPAERNDETGGSVEIAEEDERNQNDSGPTLDSNLENQTDQVSEEPDEEYHDSFDEFSSLASEKSDTSESLSSELTTDIEMANTPIQNNDDEDDINNPSNNDAPRNEALALNAEDPHDSMNDLALASQAEEDNTGVSNTSASESTEENPQAQVEEASTAAEETAEVTNESVSSLQERIDWDKELDELLELVEL